MPYTAEISRVNPSCFLFLIDQSGSMSDPFGGEESGKIKADGVADAINRLLQNLILRCVKEEGVRDYYEVGVIGYGGGVKSAFAGSLAEQDLVPISQIADKPADIEERTKKVEDGAGGLVDETTKFALWFKPVAKGETPMSQALSHAHNLLQDWLGQHSDSYPPIVINITDGEATDGNPLSPAKTLTELSTNDGNVLLFNCHISSHKATPINFPDSKENLPDEYGALLWEMSSVLPGNLREVAQSEGFPISAQSRGFAFNADLVELIQFIDIGTRSSGLR